MFDKLNLTPTGIMILIHLARSSGREYYLREIAGALDISVGGCHKLLGELHDMNLITKRSSGKNLYFGINEENKAVRHFKIFANIQELNDVVNKVKENTRKITLYGSCATGEDTLESDIDVLIITENKDGLKSKLVKEINHRPLKPMILAPHEFIQFKQKDKAFYDEVNKGIVLWRDTDE